MERVYLKGLRALNHNRARETVAMELLAEGQSISLLNYTCADTYVHM